jgi:hypothetical protein
MRIFIQCLERNQVKKIITEWRNMDNRLVAELKEDHKVVGSVASLFISYERNNEVFGNCDVRNEASWKLLEIRI